MKRISAINNKTNKKVFKPNLNVIRKKQMPIEFKARPEIVKPERKRIIPKHETGRFIITNGIFSDDTPEHKREKLNSMDDYDISYSMSKPKLSPTQKKISKKEEAGVVNNLLELEECIDDIKLEHQPLLLPLSNNKNGFFTNAASKKTMEAMDINLSQQLAFSRKLYSDHNIGCTLIKLPECLPAKGFDQEGNSTDCTLKHLQEGQIGKILIRKSGRMEMQIGNMTYGIEPALVATCREDLMCMPTTETNDKRKMINLGPVTDKFILTSCWDELLNGKKDS